MYIENAFPLERLLIYQKWVGNDKNKAVALCTLDIAVS